MDDQSKEFVETKTTDVPAIGITLQYPLDEGAGRSLVFQSFVAADCAPSAINAALDKIRAAADRQRALVVLPTLRGQLSDFEDAVHNETVKHLDASVQRDEFNNRIGRLQQAAGRRTDKLGSQDIQEKSKLDQAISNATSQLGTLKKMIAVQKRKIEDAEKLIADGE